MPDASQYIPDVPRIDILKHSSLLRGSYINVVRSEVKQADYALWFQISTGYSCSITDFIRDIVDYYIDNVDCSTIPYKYSGNDGQSSRWNKKPAGVRVTDCQYKNWTKTAKDIGVPLGTFVRMCVNHFVDCIGGNNSVT